MSFLLPIGLVLLFIITLMTSRASRRLPVRELQHRSKQSHDRPAKAFYLLSAFGSFGQFSLWLISSLSLAGFLYITFGNSWWAGFLSVIIATVIIAAWHQNGTSGWAWSIAGTTASLLAKLLKPIKPLSDAFNRATNRFSRTEIPAQLYGKQDLLKLLKSQSRQPDNSIAESELRRAVASLEFGEKKVSQVMLPNRKAKWLEANELISPTVMDELHQTGQKYFALTKSAKAPKPEIIGTLYIGDLLHHLDKPARLKDLMKPGAYFINESASLEQALGAFMKTGTQLLLAVDGRQTITGLLPVDSLIKEALGPLQIDDFHDYDDIRLAADHKAGD